MILRPKRPSMARLIVAQLIITSAVAFMGYQPLSVLTAGRVRSISYAESDAESRMKAADALLAGEENAQVRAAMPGNDLNRGVFPLSKIVGQESIKSALLLAVINPRMGGVAISGGRGTAKSVMARAVHRIMPPIEIVKGSQFNIDPESNGEVDDFLKDSMAEKGQVLSDLETEIVPCPFVQIPLNVMEDRMLGSVNVEKSVTTGKTIFEPGLLAKAHRGILYVDDINLLDSEMANILLSILSEGWVNVQREGISVRFPCRPLIIATFNPEEAELREHLLDRLSVALSADAKPLTMEERIEAVSEVMDFAKNEDTMNAKVAEDEDALTSRIIFARESLKDIQLSYDQKVYLAEEASRAGCQGHRGEIFGVEIARASAALNDRTQVEADDLRMAVKLAILPRSTFSQDPDMDDEMIPPPPPPPPPQQDMQDEEEETEEQPDTEEDEEDKEDQEDQDDEPDQPEVPQEFMFDPEGTPIDPELLEFAKKNKMGKGGGRGMVFSQDRGRYIKPMLPRGKVTRLAVDATMRAAAPYQKPRRERAGPDATRKVFIEQGDVRIKRMARKAGSLIIFVCDASGSMALNRMNAAKGAAMSLLTEAYQSRDKIAIIPFQGDRAEVLLPPTRSIAMARRRLETMPCGGGSPLAHALNVAVRTGVNAQKSGDVGKVVIVCISDGRANVPLSFATDELTTEEREKPDKAELKEELLTTAKSLRGLAGFSLVVLDTENKFVSTGMAKEIAAAAGGKYHYIPKASESAISSVASQALSDARSN